MSALLRHRFSLSAAVMTGLALLVVSLRAPTDAAVLLGQNGMALSTIQLVYAVVLAGCAVLWWKEDRLRARLTNGKWATVLIAVAGITACLLVTMLPPDQGLRLLEMPFSLWVIIAQGVGLCVLVAVWAVQGQADAPDARLMRMASIVLTGLCVLMLALHIGSVGRFMTLDLPDEPWLSAPAANYALTGQFTSPQLAWTYGITDPVLQRFYLVMGMWLKLVGSTSVTALRAFSLLVGGAAVLTFGLMMWRLETLNRIQKLAGMATLLGFSAFVRSSHNLRADVMLALYGALLLWGLVRWFGESSDHRPRWLVVMGLALVIGMEGVPTVSLVFTVLVGFMLCFEKGRFAFKSIVLYIAACGVALLIYAAVRFLPDVGAGLRHYGEFVQYYAEIGLIGLRFPLERLVGYNLRFELILSPVETLTLAAAVALLWRGSSTDKRIAVLVTAAVLLMTSLFTASYGYWAIMTPFVAYAAARALRDKLTLVVGAFILLPAMLTAPARDMATAIQVNPNQTLIEGADLMSGQFPPGTRMVGDELFWFTLHADHTFIGWWGFDRYNETSGLTLRDGLVILDIQAAICDEQDRAHVAALVQTGLFEPPTEFYIKRKGYWLFWRKA